MKDEKIYIGQTHRFIVQQTIGFGKILDKLKECFEVKELNNQLDTIVLIEEKEDERSTD